MQTPSYHHQRFPENCQLEFERCRNTSPESPGNSIVIEHPGLGGFFSFYAHLATIENARWEGEDVFADTLLGTVGDTGFAEGCHLHLEIRNFVGEYHPGDGICTASTYQPKNPGPNPGDGDYRTKECFLRDWRDPMGVSVGQFQPGTTNRPTGFVDSPIVSGIDVSTPSLSSRMQDAYIHHNEKEPFFKTLGIPFNHGGGAYVHCWSEPGPNPRCVNGVWLQDLKSETEPDKRYGHGHTALILNTTMKEAFLLKEGFWNTYFNQYLRQNA